MPLVVPYCPADNVRSTGYLCGNSRGWLTPLDNQTCGEPGLYNISKSEIIPESDVPDSWSWLVTVKLGNDEVCEADGTSAMSMASNYLSGVGGGGGRSSSSEGSSGGTGGGDGSHHVSYSMMGAIFGTAFGAAIIGKMKKMSWRYACRMLES